MTKIELPAEFVISQMRAIERAMAKATRETLIDHKRTGDPIVVVRDGQVCWIPAEEIVIPEEPAPIGVAPRP